MSELDGVFRSVFGGVFLLAVFAVHHVALRDADDTDVCTGFHTDTSDRGGGDVVILLDRAVDIRDDDGYGATGGYLDLLAFVICQGEQRTVGANDDTE